jgi:hypothetical protein
MDISLLTELDHYISLFAYKYAAPTARAWKKQLLRPRLMSVARSAARSSGARALCHG